MIVNLEADGYIMKKKLISAENISEFLGDGREFHVDNSMLLTSGAKDYLREKGVKLVYGKQPSAGSCPAAAGTTAVSADLKTVVTRIVSILRNDLQVRDAGTVERVTQKVLCGLKRG